MKKLKRIFICSTALAMAFSFVAMSGCDNETPDTGDNPGGDSVQLTPAETDKVKEEISKQEFSALKLDFKGLANITETVFDCSEYGDKTSEGTFRATQKVTAEGQVLVDLAELNADCTLAATMQTLDENGVSTGEAPKTAYEYGFIREGYLFDYSSMQETKDFSGVMLDYQGYMMEDFDTVKLMLASMGLDVGKTESASLAPLVLLLSLGDGFEGVTYQKDVLTVDVNKLIYGIYTAFMNDIDALTETTTVGELYAKDSVKGLVTALGLGVDVKEIYDLAAEVIAGIGDAEAQAVLALLPVPTAGQSVYDYLKSVLESPNIGAILTERGIVPQGGTVSGIKIIDLINMAMAGEGAPTQPMTMAQVKDMVKGVITAAVTVQSTSLTVNDGIALSDCQIKLFLDDSFRITSVKFKAKLGGIKEENFESVGGKYKLVESLTSTEVEVDITFSQTEYQLKDISKTRAVYEVYSEDESMAPLNGIYYLDGGATVFELTFVEGEVTEAYVVDKIGGTRIEPSEADFSNDTYFLKVLTVETIMAEGVIVDL